MRQEAGFMEALAIINVKHLAQYLTHNHFLINNNNSIMSLLFLSFLFSLFPHQENYEQVGVTVNLTTSKILI